MPAVRCSLHRLPRWLILAAWLTIAVEAVVAAGYLATVGRETGAHRHAALESSPPGDVKSLLDGSAPSGHHVNVRARTHAVRELLARRAQALMSRDRAGFLATVDPHAVALRARQKAFFDNIASVPLSTWTYELNPNRQAMLPPAVVPVYGQSVWAPSVRLRYGLRDYDSRPTVQQRRYLFNRRGERWYLADDGLSRRRLGQPGSGTVANLWDFGPVTAVASQSVLVLGHPGAEDLMRSVLAVATEAVPRVAQVWPDWDRRAVVLTPEDADELGQLIEEPGDLSRMAAFTSVDVPHTGPAAGKRVLVNPDVLSKLSPYGRRIVLTHEITHVAARHVTTTATPYWLAEGFADYVAYRGAGVSVRVAARELAREVREGKLPDELPTAADFDPGNRRLSAAYQQSWLACKLIAERAGDAALVRLYRRLSAGGEDPQRNLEVALREELNLGAADFVALWRDYLEKHLKET
ncbi:MAG: M48 family metalloprotease [Micromonosporaceae bacterium]